MINKERLEHTEGTKLEKPHSWVVSNKQMKIVLSAKTNGGLSALVDIKTGRNFISSALHSLYRLTLYQKGKDLVELTFLDADSFNVERLSSPKGETLTLTYSRHRSLDISVICRVLLEPDSAMSKWRISVRNNTSYGVRVIYFPVVMSPTVLGDSDEDDVFISSYGEIFKRPNALGCQCQYPAETQMQQLQIYYDKTAGLYMATYDHTGSVKTFGITPDENAFNLTIGHRYNESPGLSFDLPYETVVGIFHGDWYTAADIYKEWAHKQYWCAKKLVDRDDIPAWVKEPRPWLAIISRGNYARLRGLGGRALPAEYPIGKFWPAKKVVVLMRKYANVLSTPVVTWMEGWEKIGAPGGPVDIFPPLEGEKSFKIAMAELIRDGNHPFMYLAGFHWCYKRPMTGYDNWEHFEREGRKMAILRPDGSIINEIHNALKCFVRLCIGSEDTQKLYLANFMKLMDLGGVALQMDQQVCFQPEVCYSDDHGHPPGYGPWMYEEMHRFIRRSRKEIKKINPNATLSVEEPCEIWIQELDLFMERPYLRERIPLFDYIYHEYALCYGGDGRMGYCHPEVSLLKHATCCVYGIQNLVGIGEGEYDIEVDPEYPALILLRNISQAQRTYARDYLVFGKMLRPTELKVNKIRMDVYGDSCQTGQVEDVPCVVHGVWESSEGKIGYILVNWTGTVEKVTLTLVKTNGAVSIVSATDRRKVPEEKLEAGKVTTIVPPRSVMLIE